MNHNHTVTTGRRFVLSIPAVGAAFAAMRFAWVAGLSLSVALGLAGCASTNTATKSASLDGSAWVLASLPGRSLVPDATPTARFEAGRVAGSDGCNRYSMPFTAQGSMIEIGPLGPSTQMACSESTMAQAEAFTTALRIARSIRRGAGTLDPSDMADITLSYAFPTSDSEQEEKFVEGFYRWQLTRFTQVSVGAQAIFDPGNSPDHDVVGAFWGRFRILF